MKREENPYEDPKIARQWIKSVEGERNINRDKEIYPLLKKWLKHNKMKKILDVGAGQGEPSKYIKGKGYVGVEPSPTLVARAKRRFKGKEFVIGNAYELPFDNETFDGALSINVWFHLKYPAKAFKELSRVLMHKGRFLIVSACPDYYKFWIENHYNRKITGKMMVGRANIPNAILPKARMYFHTQKQMLTAIFKAGLIIEKTGRIGKYKEGYLFQCYIGYRK